MFVRFVLQQMLSTGQLCPHSFKLGVVTFQSSFCPGFWLIFLLRTVPCVIPLMPSASGRSMKGAGPQTRTVPSSEALARSPGTTGFQLTQFTVRVWPVSSAIGNSLRRCHTYTLWSERDRRNKTIHFAKGVIFLITAYISVQCKCLTLLKPFLSFCGDSTAVCFVIGWSDSWLKCTLNRM